MLGLVFRLSYHQRVANKGAHRKTAATSVVCTENLIRVDDVMELPKLGNDWAALFRSGRLAIQVEVAA